MSTFVSAEAYAGDCSPVAVLHLQQVAAQGYAHGLRPV